MPYRYALLRAISVGHFLRRTVDPIDGLGSHVEAPFDGEHWVLFKYVKKYWQLSWQDRALLLEAFFFLTVASIAIAALPLRKVGALAGWPVRVLELSDQVRLPNIKRIRWAVVATAARVPWRALCFQKGLAAQLMLLRPRVASALDYGALQDGQKGLQAHVWVRDGDTDVVGCEIASRYAVLASFPPQNKSAVSDSHYRHAG